MDLSIQKSISEKIKEAVENGDSEAIAKEVEEGVKKIFGKRKAGG